MSWWHRLLPGAFAALTCVTAASGQTGSVSGVVRTADGAPVSDATLVLAATPPASWQRTIDSDSLGTFVFYAVPPGEYDLRVYRIGFRDAGQRIAVGAAATSRVDVVLTTVAVELAGVRADVARERSTFESEAGATIRDLDIGTIKALPGLGEADVLRAVEVLPGVVSTSDFSSAFNVRGGSADQNLILLDGLPIYNPFHLGGVFSVFNSDMVARAELMAGGFPARYGGRVASVLNVESAAGPPGFHGAAGVSLLATRVALADDIDLRSLGLEGARVRGSLRRSYFDVLFSPFFDFPYHLTDAQVHATARTRAGGRLTLTAYSGRDVLDLTATDSFPLRVRWRWGNDVIGASYAHPLADGRLVEGRLGFTRFRTGLGFPDFDDTDLRSRIDHLLGRLEYVAPVSETGSLRVGTALDRLAYDNAVRSAGTTFTDAAERGTLTGAFAQLTWTLDAWLVEAGVRVDAWVPDGGDVIVSPAPRLAVKRFLGPSTAAKLAIGRYTQFTHSLRDEELPLGIDIWVVAGDRAPHTVSEQVQLGIESFLPAGWYASLEAYLRTFDGVVTTNFADNPNDAADDIIGGDGRAWGADLLIRREGERLRPSLALSLLRTWRAFPDTRSGVAPAPVVRYPPIFDRRIDVDVVLEATLPRGIEGALRWNLGSGLPYTRPVGSYIVYDYRVIEGTRGLDDDTAPTAVVLGQRNADRYPVYHRLDVGVRKTIERAWGSYTPYLDVLNIYNRRNPLFYFYEYDRDPPRRSGISMFPVLPTFGVEVRF